MRSHRCWTALWLGAVTGKKRLGAVVHHARAALSLTAAI